MALLAAAIAWWRGDSLWLQPVALPAWLPFWFVADVPQVTALSLAGGVLIASVTIGSTSLLVRRVRWARSLRADFRAALEGATDGDVAVLALSSGFAEELLFRGAIQPALGLIVTSLLFGAVHFVPSKRLLPWTAWAAVMGLVLGLLYEHTGSIAGCIVAHVAINWINLRRIVRFDPSLDDEPSAHAPPSLVGRRRTRSQS